MAHFSFNLGPLGLPTSDEITNPDGVSKRNTFQYGGDFIYWSPATGAQEIGGSIFQHWGDFGYETGPLGYPISDEVTSPDGVGRFNTFQNAGDHIYWSPASGAHEIGGAIFDHWGTLGYETGALGYPTSDEITTPDGAGKFNTFQNNASIYWSPNTPASEIGGAIRDHWGALGYEGGPLGYPTTDELASSSIAGARLNGFQGGSIYWSPGTGANAVRGAIFGQWAELSFEAGPLGLPTSDEYPSGGRILQNFQSGQLEWSPSMSDGSTSSYSYGGTSADAAAFWTPQRMASAVSLDPPGNDFPSPANQASGASGASVRAAGPVRTVPPIEAATPQPGVSSAAVTGLSPAAGKLFFTIVGTDSVERPFVCSASTINTPSKSIIATAAHCAFSPHAGDWHQNIMFAPGYINGSTRFGVYKVKQARVYNVWQEYGSVGGLNVPSIPGYRYDVSWMGLDVGTTGSRAVDAVGANGIAFSGESTFNATVLGYPVAVDGGQTQQRCDAQARESLWPGQSFLGCSNLGGGASGGPWLTSCGSNGLGTVQSVTSTEASGKIFQSAYFIPAMTAGFDLAESDAAR